MSKIYRFEFGKDVTNDKKDQLDLILTPSSAKAMAEALLDGVKQFGNDDNFRYAVLCSFISCTQRWRSPARRCVARLVERLVRHPTGMAACHVGCCRAFPRPSFPAPLARHPAGGSSPQCRPVASESRASIHSASRS